MTLLSFDEVLWQGRDRGTWDGEKAGITHQPLVFLVPDVFERILAASF